MAHKHYDSIHISRRFVWLSRARITRTTCISLTKWSTEIENISQNLNKIFKTTRTIICKHKIVFKNQGVWKLSWAQNWAWSVVATMRFSDQLSWKRRHMASKSTTCLATLFDWREIGAGPPVIMRLSVINRLSASAFLLTIKSSGDRQSKLIN
jgi:hypothetical protein